MKKIMTVSLLCLLFSGCIKEKSNEKDSEVQITNAPVYASFGEKIDEFGTISRDSLSKIYATMKPNDTINVKFSSTIEEVCSKKGCWMNVNLEEEKNTLVRFKDYGFFMPLNAAGSETIVEGKAFIETISIEDLKHYALDANKTQEEIDAITEPKVTYAFTANGVLIKE